MKNFNPFYTKASKKDPMAAARAKRQSQFMSDLTKKANQKSTSAKPAKKK
jgi:anionic cell wall polymer biosynthesis LytR-Cps2A-Psr (LCP) family protein